MFFEPVFPNNQCKLWKGYRKQHCLLVMIEKCKKCLDRNGVCGALLTDFPKEFDCLPHSLLILKLHILMDLIKLNKILKKLLELLEKKNQKYI